MSSLKTKVEQIVKFINEFYKPIKIKVTSITISDKKEYIIGVYFKNIDDKYISNPDNNDIKKLKENMICREIRTYVEDYLGIKTTGLQPKNNFYSPTQRYGITIVAQSEK